MSQRLQLAALVLGLGLFASLIYGIGPWTIVADLGQIGWGIAVIVGLELAVDAVNTMGWRLTFAPSDRTVSFPVLFLVRLAGTAVNQAVPAATVGGEPVKVMLLRPYVAAANAWASVITAKLSYGVAQSVFVLCGLLVAFRGLDVPTSISRALFGALGLTLAGLAAFFGLQRRGLFAATGAAAGRLGLPEYWTDWLRRATGSLDDQIRDVLVLRRGDFLRSVAWHLSAFAIGVLQVFLLLRWLGLPADLLTCVAIETFSLLVQLALFLVPASIGVQEGGKVLIFTALGLPAAAGLAVGLAFRLTQIAEIALGLGAFSALHWRQRQHRRDVVAGSGI
ncbi:MAG: flippase-like domain-containing protein [Candidatus Rokubacteria bacterium]|nr:flippase-like domain-containing protein [Candidatus Rokubacteria bacterium]